MRHGNREYPCPCCGYLTFDLPPGSDEVCRTCGWQDDVSQLRFVLSDGGANSASLVQAQKNFVRAGRIRRPRLNGRDQQRINERDPSWRMVDLDRDNVEHALSGVDYGLTYPTDRTTLYYWGANYWRKR
ncbi:CPCC family cysteine-rich protein [Bradyrhizobium sp.]|uniref:CPCC family cysteine-rich protein n=1 Tax=Bradyrhizobium sp. TaxID=376 RepID=UPI00344E47D0